MFEPDKWYSDRKQAKILDVCGNTISNWRRYLGYPSGILFGRVRRELGSHLNAWIDSQPRDAKLKLASGMRGRPRKVPRGQKSEGGAA
jgi:hypothetical protein